jgi:uncharacterized protein (DUF1501 family)
MQRREFIKNTGKIGVGSLLLNGIPVNSIASPMTGNFTCQEIANRILVMINLAGANDSLNTVIPKAQYSLYVASRPTIKIPEASALILDPSNTANPTTLHPKLSPFKTLYDAGKLNVVHGVGYADNNRSHFKSDDLWNTAGDVTPANFSHNSGWAGQLFEHRYPGLLGSTSPTMPDPPCIELGATNGSLLFQTATNNNASVLLTNTNVGSYYNTLIDVGGPAPATFPNSDYGIELKYVDDIQKLSSFYAQRIQTVFNAGSNSVVTYPNTYIASQLKTVARLIKGGSKSTVYMVHQGSYDTHGTQVNTANTTLGTHANLLNDLALAVKAFQDDITLLGFEDRVISATYSEFGRTIDENAGLGTDHGGVSTMFIIGKGVQPGITGVPIDLTKVNDRGLTDLQYDYRRVWAAVLQDFLGHGSSPMAAARMSGYLATKAPIIATTHKADPPCYINQIILAVTLTEFKAILLPSGDAEVIWKTAMETNCKHFEIEYSKNSLQWNTVGTVAGSGNAAIPKNYSFIHQSPSNGNNFYRLWQVDFNGSKKAYGPVILHVKDKAGFVVKNYPNPAQFDFNIAITAEKKQKGTIQFMDTQGHLIKQVSININKGFNKFNYLTADFNKYKGSMIVYIQTEYNLKKSLRQILL